MTREPRVEYSVDYSSRNAHLYQVEARFPIDGLQCPLELRLPVWTPGSYLIREYERHLQDVTVTDDQNQPLSFKKTEKSCWTVDARSASIIRVRYRVYANDLTVRAAHLDDTHGFFNGAPLFLYLEALRGRAHAVTLRLPDGWHATTALPSENNAHKTFVAQSYDELVDSPFETGTHEVVSFIAGGKPHRLAIWGHVGKSRSELTADITKIVEVAAALFNGLPYDAYTFLLLSSPNAYGGLEHANSSTLLTSPFSFEPRKKYEEFLELVSHEFFHLWNVKRIHPKALGPFDYQHEAYTRALWMMEGVTSYYDRYLLVRAGLKDVKSYLEKLGEEIGKVAQTPGRLRQSLEEASFDAWIKFYRPDENSANSSISYYLKGGVVALLLDLEIRHRTENARSLDHVMRLFNERYGVRNEGFEESAIETTCEEASGLNLKAFFDRHVRGKDEVDADRLLATVGLELKPKIAEEPQGGWLGAQVRDDGDSAVVGTTLSDGPAELAGLFAGDEVVALDGFRVDASALKERLQQKRVGDNAELTLFRREQLRTVTVRLGTAPVDKFEIRSSKTPTAQQRSAYQSWMGAPLDE